MKKVIALAAGFLLLVFAAHAVLPVHPIALTNLDQMVAGIANGG